MLPTEVATSLALHLLRTKGSQRIVAKTPLISNYTSNVSASIETYGLEDSVTLECTLRNIPEGVHVPPVVSMVAVSNASEF